MSLLPHRGIAMVQRSRIGLGQSAECLDHAGAASLDFDPRHLNAMQQVFQLLCRPDAVLSFRHYFELVGLQHLVECFPGQLQVRDDILVLRCQRRGGGLGPTEELVSPSVHVDLRLKSSHQLLVHGEVPHVLLLHGVDQLVDSGLCVLRLNGVLQLAFHQVLEPVMNLISTLRLIHCEFLLCLLRQRGINLLLQLRLVEHVATLECLDNFVQLLALLGPDHAFIGSLHLAIEEFLPRQCERQLVID